MLKDAKNHRYDEITSYTQSYLVQNNAHSHTYTVNTLRFLPPLWHSLSVIYQKLYYIAKWLSGLAHWK